jgi:hypothetical protein
MRLLIDIGHPAHVHYFKNFHRRASSEGADILFTCREKDITIELLKYYNFKYVSFGKNYKTSIGKIFGLFYFSLRLLIIAFKFRADIYLNASIYSAFVAWLLRKPHISLEDTFNKEQVNIYLPFTSCVLTGDYEHPSLGKKELRYNGYQELLYLHPNYFKPDPSIHDDLEIKIGAPFVLIRFVSWQASHDYRHSGISFENKILAVQEFSKFAQVFISSETILPSQLKKFEIQIPPEKMHDVLFYASLFYGESGTMASECAVLGTPAIFLDKTGRYYTKDQEKKYGLVFNFSDSEDDQLKSIEKGKELLKYNRKGKFDNRRKKLLNDKIDAASFFYWFINNYPESFRIMKNNPKYQYRFK